MRLELCLDPGLSHHHVSGVTGSTVGVACEVIEAVVLRALALLAPLLGRQLPRLKCGD